MPCWALLLAALVGVGACSRSDVPVGAAPSASAAIEVTPVPAPGGLIADLFLPRPDQTWKALRDLVGGPALLLQSSFSLFAGTALGLPTLAAANVSADVPMVGALGEVQDEVAAVLGLHVVSGGELVAQLTSGADAAFDVELDPSTGIQVLTRKQTSPGDVVLGVFANRLLVAPSRVALLALGPYVARTLPGAVISDHALTLVAKKDALVGPAARALRSEWKTRMKWLQERDQAARLAHGGAAPDFADPAAVVAAADGAVDGIAALLESASEARFVLDARNDRLELGATLAPEAGGAADAFARSLTVGDAAPVLALASDAAVALMLRGDVSPVAGPEGGAESGLVALLGDRLSAADKKRVTAIRADLDAGRGALSIAGLVPGEHFTVVVTGDTVDAVALERGIKGALGLLSVPALRQPAERLLGKLTLKNGTTQVVGLEGKVQRVTLALAAPTPGAPAPRPLDLLWHVSGQRWVCALGGDPAPALAAWFDTAHTRWSSDALLSSWVTSLGPEVTGLLVVRPGALALTRPDAKPVILAGGRGTLGMWLRALLGREALQTLAKSLVL